MKKVALVIAAAIALSNVNAGAIGGINSSYTVFAETVTQKTLENKLFNEEITNSSVTYQFKDGVLTVSGTGIADNTYRKTVDVNEIKEVVIQSGITAIGDNAFKNLKNLKKITIPNTVTTLGFYSLAGLQMDNIVIPSSVKTIGIHCMENGKIKSVTMPGYFSIKEGVDGEEDIGYPEELRYTILPSTDVVNLNTGFSPSVMKFFHTAKKVQTAKTDKKYKTFGKCIYTKNGKKLVFVATSVKNLKIRKGCKTVSLNSFCYAYEPEDYSKFFCDKLKTVDVPASVKTFIDDAEHSGGYRDPMEECKFKFHTKKLPGNIISRLHREYVRDDCNKYLSKKYGVKKVNGMYISYDKVLITYKGKSKNVTIPKGVKTIAPYAFGSSKVKKVSVSSTVKTIDNRAFFYTRSLQSVKLPKGLKTIGNGAFEQSTIKKITLPKKLQTIGKEAFRATPLKSIVIPNSVKKCGDDCFVDASHLKKVTLSKNMTSIPDGMFENTAISQVTITGNIKVIGNGAFGGKNIKRVELQEGVESFYANSFFNGNNNVVEISIPKSLKEIRFSIKSGYYVPSKYVLNYSTKSDLSNAQTKSFENAKEIFDMTKLDRSSDIYCQINVFERTDKDTEKKCNSKTYHFTFK